MEMLPRITRLLEYDAWANRESLESLKGTNEPPDRARRFLAHILGAERLWLERLRQEPQSAVVWPSLTVAECESRLQELSREWKTYVGGLTEEKLLTGVSYRNTKGESWTSSIEDILLHVVLHSSYHRGQIASALREHDLTPAYTDYIHCIRQGFLD